LKPAGGLLSGKKPYTIPDTPTFETRWRATTFETGWRAAGGLE
jgi:hypothetical protein